MEPIASGAMLLLGHFILGLMRSFTAKTFFVLLFIQEAKAKEKNNSNLNLYGSIFLQIKHQHHPPL